MKTQKKVFASTALKKSFNFECFSCLTSILLKFFNDDSELSSGFYTVNKLLTLRIDSGVRSRSISCVVEKSETRSRTC